MADRYTSTPADQITDGSIKKDELNLTNTPTDGQIVKINMPTGDFTAIDISTISGSTYKQTFVDGDLTSSKITITHNLDVGHPVVVVYNNNDDKMNPSEITYVTDNSIELDFTGLTPLTGTYKVRVIGATGSTGSFSQAFTNSDLSSGVLTATHSLNRQHIFVSVYDNNDDLVLNADSYNAVDANNFDVDLSTLAPITGTWNIIITSGGTGSGSSDSISDDDNDTKVETEKNSDEDIIRFTTAGTQRSQMDANGLKLESGADVNEFSIDGTLAGNSDDAVPTEKAVKTYVDANAGSSIDVTKNQDNIALNAFRIAINGSLSIFNMVDGIVDEYEDETGIDTGSSTNESYNATDDLYSPEKETDTKLLTHLNGADTATSTTDESYLESTITFNGTAQLDTAQKKFGTASLLLDGNSDYLTIASSSNFNLIDSLSTDWTVDLHVRHTNSPSSVERYIGFNLSGSYQWDMYRDSSGYAVARAFASGGTAYIATASTAITDSNWHHLCLAKVGAVVGIYLDGNQVAYDTVDYTQAITGILEIGRHSSSIQYYDGHMDEIRIIKSNDFSASPNVGLTDTITVPTVEYASVLQNMTLISDTFTAESVPTTARIILFEEDVDSITLNTDIIAKVSRDGGTTYSTVTLSNQGEYEVNKNIISESVDISGQPSGTSMKYKIETANNKDLNLHGTGLSWD